MITSIVGTDGDEAEYRRWGKLNESVIGIKDEGLSGLGCGKLKVSRA
jgi:hypothetical protein